jgi:hypothetical protein
MAHTAQKQITVEQHAARHRLLHQMLDELVADFLYHNRDKTPSNTSVFALTQWAARELAEPSPHS